jgi:hypothetical protein
VPSSFRSQANKVIASTAAARVSVTIKGNQPQMNADKQGSFLSRAEFHRCARPLLELLYDNPNENCRGALKAMRKWSDPFLSAFICGESSSQW